MSIWLELSFLNLRGNNSQLQRDIEIFRSEAHVGTHLRTSPYAFPTDMGVNMVGFAIVDNDAAIEASQQEIIRRYYQTILMSKQSVSVKELSRRSSSFDEWFGNYLNDRKVTVLARQKKKKQVSQPWPLNSKRRDGNRKNLWSLWPNCSPSWSMRLRNRHILIKKPN